MFLGLLPHFLLVLSVRFAGCFVISCLLCFVFVESCWFICFRCSGFRFDGMLLTAVFCLMVYAVVLWCLICVIMTFIVLRWYVCYYFGVHFGCLVL